MSLMTSVLFVLTSFLIAYYIARLIQIRQAYLKFKHVSKGLPILEPTFSLGGNASRVFFESDSYSKLEQLFRFYGKTFGIMIGPRPLAMSVDLDLLKTMHIDEQNVHINREPFFFAVRPFEKDSIMFARGDQWKRIRRAMAPSFTRHSLQMKNVVEEIDTAVGHFVDSLNHKHESTGRKEFEINVDDLMGRYSTDLVFSCFYKQYNVIDYKGEVDYYSNLIHSGVESLTHPAIEVAVWMPFLKPLILWYSENMHPIKDTFAEVLGFITKQTKLNFEATKQIAEMKKAGLEFNPDDFVMKDGTRFKRNLVDAFIESFREGKLTKDEYTNSAYFLFMAGIRTSADILSKLFYELATHQEVQEKLRCSILEDGIESDYMVWCINEALRLHPPAPIACSRIVERDMELEEGIGVIPKGTFVFTPAHIIHRMPEYWGSDANLYRPERWQDAKLFHPMQFIPFGHGRRMCPGKEFAMSEMKKLLATILPKYTIERCFKTSDTISLKSPYHVFNVYDNPTYVKLRKVTITNAQGKC